MQKHKVWMFVLRCVSLWALVFALPASPSSLFGPGRGAAQGRAGEPVELLLVNMTPDPVTNEQRTCSRRIRRYALGQGVHLHTLGETATRAAAHGSEDYFRWSTNELERIRALGQTRGRLGYDVVLLFDCRPELREANALLFRAGGVMKHLRLRDVDLDRGGVLWFAEGVFRGFL